MRRILLWVWHRAPYIFIVVMMSVVLGIQSGQIDDLKQVQSDLRQTQRDQKAETAARIAAAEKDAVDRLMASCESGNEFRANDLASWQYILGLARDNETTQGFRRFIVDKDKPRNCKALAKP